MGGVVKRRRWFCGHRRPHSFADRFYGRNGTDGASYDFYACDSSRTFFREEVFLGGRLYKTVFFSCILFLVSIFISGFFSFDRYTTARLFLIFFSAFIVFIKTPSIIKEFAKIERFFSWLLWGTILFSLYGLYIFFGAHPFFRLGSVFYQQNAFAGFMLPSLFFATSFLFYESKQSRKWWYAAINIFLFCTLFFTFARGAALAFLGSFLITMFLLRWPFSKIWRRSATLFLLMAVSILLATAAFQFKNHPQSVASGTSVIQPTDIFKEESASENGLTARLEYLYQSARIFSYSPLFGVGWGSFGDAMTEYRDRLTFYTTDPHNILARGFVELGIFGGVVLVLFLAALLVMVFSVTKNRNHHSLHEEQMLYVVVGSFLALVFQNMVNADWIFPADVFLFFIVAGIVLRLYLSSENKKDKTQFSFIFNLFVIVFSFIALIFGCMSVLAEAHFTEASMALAEGDMRAAYEKYDAAVRSDAGNPLYHRDLAILSLRLASGVPDEKERVLYRLRAFQEITEALRTRPKDPYLFYLRGQARKLEGDLAAAETDFMTATDHDHFMLFSAYRELSNLYLEEKNYQAIIDFLEPIVVEHTPEAFRSIAWINPYKDENRKDVADLWVRLGLAHVGIGDRSGAEKSFTNALSFSLKNGYAKQGIRCLQKPGESLDIFRACFNLKTQ